MRRTSSASPRRPKTTTSSPPSPRKPHADSLSAFYLKARAYFVHLYTASTVVTHIAALQYLYDEKWSHALLAMVVAVLIDATDGTMARAWNVKKYASGIDGRRLDDIIDFISFAFLPMAFLVKAKMIIQPTLLFASLPLIASAFGFGRVHAKLDDEGFFVGFPSYWNIVVFYMYMLGSSPLVNSVFLVIFSIMVFLPTRYIYPTRYAHFKWLHLTGSYGMGAAMTAALIVSDPYLKLLLLRASLVYPVFYTVISFYEEFKARTRQQKKD